MDRVLGLESDLEEIRSDKRTPAPARSAAARAGLRVRSGRDAYVGMVELIRQGLADSATWRGAEGEAFSDLLSVRVVESLDCVRFEASANHAPFSPW